MPLAERAHALAKAVGCRRPHAPCRAWPATTDVIGSAQRIATANAAAADAAAAALAAALTVTDRRANRCPARRSAHAPALSLVATDELVHLLIAPGECCCTLQEGGQVISAHPGARLHCREAAKGRVLLAEDGRQRILEQPQDLLIALLHFMHRLWRRWLLNLPLTLLCRLGPSPTGRDGLGFSTSLQGAAEQRAQRRSGAIVG